MSCSSAKTEIKGRRGSLDIYPPNMSLRRLVLVGKTGAGKSSSGNTILGRKAFRAAKSGLSVTKKCRKETAEVAGREITLVDTPGLFDTDASEEYLKQEISKCINMTAPGPHAIILVIQAGPFTKEERDSVEKIRALFGEEADKHTIILFTHGDELAGTIEKHISDARENLKETLRRCGGRYHVFNNKDIDDRNQVLQLLEKVEDMIAANAGRFYTSESYQDVELMLKTKEEELRREYDRKLQDIQRELESRFNEEKKKLQDKLDTLTASEHEEKKKLQDKLDTLTASEQQKEKKIKELEKLNERKNIEFIEYQRYYEAKLREVRHEAEQTRLNESKLLKIFRKFQTIQL